MLINKKKKILNFSIPADYRLNMKESGKLDKHLDLDRELKKKKEEAVKHEGDGDTNLDRSQKAWKRHWRNWKSEEEPTPYRLQHCNDQPKYSEES